MHKRLTLAQLHIGQLARIQQVLDGPFKEKLLEMGCVPGVLIKPLFKAPLGDPIAYNLEEYTLSIRKSEARQIIVKPLDILFKDEQ
ncbi:MAG: ferrous iron transport protein A [Bacteroidia bacterium]|nr:ferrous iron transport protein A [Bacteroidia bacterium]NNJ55308.1 ferrous iron transport protein A [Bacteroidia bacterium]